MLYQRNNEWLLLGQIVNACIELNLINYRYMHWSDYWDFHLLRSFNAKAARNQYYVAVEVRKEDVVLMVGLIWPIEIQDTQDCN